MFGDKITVVYPDGEEVEYKRVEYGVWKPYQTPLDKRQTGWICGNCSGVVFDLSMGDTDFCPNCGAIMDKEE